MSRNPDHQTTPDSHVDGMFYPAIEYRNRVHLVLGGLYGLGWLRAIEAEDSDHHTPVRTIDVPRELGYPPLPYVQYIAQGVHEALNAIAHPGPAEPTHPLFGQNPCETIQELATQPHRLIPDFIDFYTQNGHRARPMDRAARLSITNPATRTENLPLIHLDEIAAPIPADYETASRLQS